KNMHYQDRDLLNAFYFAMQNKKIRKLYAINPSIYKENEVKNNIIKFDDDSPPYCWEGSVAFVESK
ncbi:hypothetical protein SZ25_00276, partial [Candidatus Arcanobacter lacustris]